MHLCNGQNYRKSLKTMKVIDCTHISINSHQLFRVILRNLSALSFYRWIFNYDIFHFVQDVLSNKSKNRLENID